jgi:hypothetical protein
MISHKKKYGIYHWDTFDNYTFLVDEASTIEEAEEKIQKHYKGCLNGNGADQVDIVDQHGNVIKNFAVS